MTKQPSYRFAEYTESWVEKKLGEIVERITRKNKNLESDLPLTISAQYGLIDQETFFNKKVASKDVSGYYLLKKGEFAYNKSYSSDYPWGAVKRLDNYEMGVLSTLYIVFRPNSIDSDFLAVYYDSPKWYKEVSMRAAEGARNHGLLNISPQDFFDTELIFPVNQSEQTALGSFFQDTDQLISLQQRKLEVLKEQKKTYLKLLFPAKGQTKPALRFAGFEDDWKEVKLGEHCDIATGKLDANAMVTDGEYDFYTSGIQKYKIDVAAFEGPAITIAGNGATVGYMHYADGKFNAYQRTYVLSNFLVDRSFIYSEIGRKLPSKIQQEARTGNIPYIVMDMLTKLDICLPSLPEQEVIGSFFQDLDKAIAKQEEKVNQLKESKKTLLRKMFI
ncbi:restriction endonuclease subunit S [uncultured Streptococcus sp.]|uniref:restriction endonuclease subunit S n=1 Tax=uncultured Streptococcus sp. TaxID=83427 RepID=UPI0021B847CB|nr:restriction endonuclease subunit S [uncultured Streptococcus sp.]